MRCKRTSESCKNYFARYLLADIGDATRLSPDLGTEFLPYCDSKSTDVVTHNQHSVAMVKVDPTDIQKRFGNRLRELRVERAISQEKLGFDAGVDRTYVNSVEMGKRNISLVNIVKLATALQVSVGQFFDS